MADRRCLHKKILESDSFYNLPASAQALYVHLNMAADDDGFVNCASSICTRFKTGKADLKRLVSERFLLKFGEVYVVKHWRISNSLKNDRRKPLTYPGIGAQIWIKPNRAYTDHPVEGCFTLLESKTESKMESQPNRREPNRTEPKRTEPNRSADADFRELFLCYPENKRGSESKAKDAFREQITSAEECDQAMDNLALWKRSEQWTKEGGQFIPYLCNWLERGIWRTSPPDAAPRERELSPDELEAIRRMLEEDDT